MTSSALFLSIALGLAGIAGPAHAAVEPGAIGFWLNPEQGWVVETVHCDSGLCGYLVGFRKNASPDHVARDSHNPDPTRRGTPLCGIMLLGGFTPSTRAAGRWENGWVYDTDTGTTYVGIAQLIDANTIKLRGYVLIPLFGRTLTLIREVVTTNRCATPVGN
jgi:uncharacterized protein (DUF2147 family)